MLTAAGTSNIGKLPPRKLYLIETVLMRELLCEFLVRINCMLKIVFAYKGVFCEDKGFREGKLA
jgi:hypothetical protein